MKTKLFYSVFIILLTSNFLFGQTHQQIQGSNGTNAGGGLVRAKGSPSNGVGGDVEIQAGGGMSTGGSIYIIPGSGQSNDGDLFLRPGNKGEIGFTLPNQSKGIIFRNTSQVIANFTPEGRLILGQSKGGNNTYRLDVNGKIRADEIVVNTDGADFVFDDNYILPELSQVKSFIQQNRHLPGIPSATTMQSEGMGVSEITTLLLQKIEELTLYVLQQQQEIDGLKTKINN
jgi:hypothetical protein